MCIYYDSISPSDKGYCPYQQRRNSGNIGRQFGHTSNKLEPKIYFQSIGKTIRFYASYGKENCGIFADNWCLKHCYMIKQSFKGSINKKIQEVDLRNYTFNTMSELVKCINDEKYITFFASGCIENVGVFTQDFIVKLTQKIISEKKCVKIRYFLRRIYSVPDFKNYLLTETEIKNHIVIIFSLNKTSSQHDFNNAITEMYINGIAIINHPDNKKLINTFETQAFEKTLKEHGINKIIYCKNCNGKMLCFEQTGRFILIQDYKH
jgi:hypothetical protein